MNLIYLIVPIIIGFAIGVSIFFVQQVDLTGYLVSPTSPKFDNETPQQNVLENETKCPTSCDDNNPCSIDWCNETSNYLCSHIPVNGTSDECLGNPTICNTNTCISGKCTEVSIKNCCGNNICESSENCNSCSIDCGECPPIISDPMQQPASAQSQSQIESQSTTPNQPANTETPAQSQLNHIIISEVQTGPNEFVELYNPTTADVDVTGWYLSYFSSSRDWNDTYRNWAFTNNTILRAGKFFMVNIFNTVNSDWTVLTAEGNPYSLGQISNNGSIAIFPFKPRIKTSTDARNGVIDALGWGSPAYVFEFSPVVAPDSGKSLQRNSLSSDTDNNAQDFIIGSPSPKNSIES